MGCRRRHVEVDAAMFRSDRLGRRLEVASGLIHARPHLAREGDVNLNDDGPRAESGDGPRALDRWPFCRLDLGANDRIAWYLVGVDRPSRRSRQAHEQHR